MRKILIVALILATALLLMAAAPWTSNQDRAHRIAELAREAGLGEDSAIIREASVLWWAEREDCRILANVIAHEAPCCTDRHQQLVAQVVLNRVADGRFPDTVRTVVTQPRQYHASYVEDLPEYATASAEMKRCFANAVAALDGNVDCPAEVIFQSEFQSLGAGTYERIEVNTGAYRSVTYFNYG